MRAKSTHGHRYCVGFVDDVSGYIWIRFLKTKDEWLSAWKLLYAHLKRQHNIRVKIFRCDGEAIYMSHRFTNWLAKRGMKRESTARATSQLNGRAERMWRTVVSLARSMLAGAGMKDVYWDYAMEYAVHILNRTVGDGISMTPYEALYGEKPDLSNLRVFGCAAYVKVPEDLRHKWSPKARKGIFVGLDAEKIGFRIMDPTTRKVFVVRNVVFDETLLPAKKALDLLEAQKTTTFVSEEREAQKTATFVSEKPFENDSKTHTQLETDLKHENDLTIELLEGQAQRPNNFPSLSSFDNAPAGLFSESKFEQILAENSENQEELLEIVSNEEAPQQDDSKEVSGDENLSTLAALPFDNGEQEDLQAFGDAMGTTSLGSLASLPAPVDDIEGSDDGEEGALLSAVVVPFVKQESQRTSASTTPLRGCVSVFANGLVKAALSVSSEQETAAAIPENPSSVAEAKRCADWKGFEEAMKSEAKSLSDLGTWTIIKGAPPKKAIKSKWVLSRKYVDGVFHKHKARLVACGYSQVFGVDYEEVFAPVMRLTSLRVLFTIVAFFDLNLHHNDVSTAFINADLGEEIYLKLPEYFKNVTARLNKSIYGLKQASRKWNQLLDKCLRDFGFNKEELYGDACLYVIEKGDSLIIILVWVDDFFPGWRGDALYKQYLAHCGKYFTMKDLGPLEFALGMRIQRDRANRKIYLDQEAYCLDILRTFDMQGSKPAPTPQVEKELLCKAEVGFVAEPELHKKYRSLVGKVMYLQRGTRPDISNAARELSRFLSNPTGEHWTAAKRLLRYLRGTSHYRLAFGGDLVLNPYSDADWANSEDRKSITGTLVMLGNGPVSWSSKKQQTVSLSSTESEYNALSDTTREVAWLRQLLREMRAEQKGPTTIWEDNQQTIKWALDPMHHGRNKHLDVRLHYVREQVKKGTVNVKYVPSIENLADLMTKPLGRVIFQRLTKAIMDTGPAGVCDTPRPPERVD